MTFLTHHHKTQIMIFKFIYQHAIHDEVAVPSHKYPSALAAAGSAADVHEPSVPIDATLFAKLAIVEPQPE